MARTFKPKDKDLINLEVVTADKVWTVNKLGKRVLRTDIDIYGRVDKGTSAYVTSTNLSGKNHKVVRNTCELPKKVNNEVVKLLKNGKRTVAYIVQKNQNKVGKKINE